MTEVKLRQAFQAMPEPASTFSQVEDKAYHKTRKTTTYTRQHRRATAIIVCAFLIFGCTVAAATTEVNYSAWATRSTSFWDAGRIADKLGIVLPEALGDSLFCEITTMHVVPEGTTYLQALFKSAYRWYDVDYGVRTDNAEPFVTNDEYSIAIGSTKGELWSYVFSLDETGAWALDDTLPGSYKTQEYNGVTLQIGTTVQYDRENDSKIFCYHHRVIWVDRNNNTVFVLRKSCYAEEEKADLFPEELIAFAKEIIDINSPTA